MGCCWCFGEGGGGREECEMWVGMGFGGSEDGNGGQSRNEGSLWDSCFKCRVDFLRIVLFVMRVGCCYLGSLGSYVLWFFWIVLLNCVDDVLWFFCEKFDYDWFGEGGGVRGRNDFQ